MTRSLPGWRRKVSMRHMLSPAPCSTRTSSALRLRIPTFGNYPYYAENGLLLAYGGDADPLNERAADYVDKILRGAKPGNLPVTQPVKFNLEVNLKTAKALSLVIPESFLVAADKVFK